MARYNAASKFYVHYNKIKSLMTAPDTAAVAFNTGSDMKYLRNDCKRYNLPTIDMLVHDTVDYIKLLEEQNPPVSYSLTSVCERLGVPVTGEHNSEQDALRTGYCLGIILKRIYEQSGLRFAELAEIIAARHARAGIIKPSRVNRRHIEEKAELRHRDTKFSGMSVSASHTVEDSHLFSRLAKRLVDIGAWYTTSIADADIFLIAREDGDLWRISTAKARAQDDHEFEIIGFEEFMRA
jgi:hypothetical protein